MANCITLNQTSYHGAGAIQSIPDEVKAHGLNKAFVDVALRKPFL